MQFGSGLSVIASSLPYLQPHEIPPPAPAAHSFIPFARFGAAALQTRSSEPAYLKPQLPRLAHAVLPPLPLEAPRASLLTLTLAHPDKPSRSHPFLSGTFPLPSLPAPLPLGDLIARPPSKETHAFTETVTALDDLLRYLAVGIDNLREAWAGKHGGSAATRDWVSAIGEALRQHGEDDDVKRALSGLLMTGMSGHGLMHILGGKLTPRVRLRASCACVLLVPTNIFARRQLRHLDDGSRPCLDRSRRYDRQRRPTSYRRRSGCSFCSGICTAGLSGACQFQFILYLILTLQPLLMQAGTAGVALTPERRRARAGHQHHDAPCPRAYYA